MSKQVEQESTKHAGHATHSSHATRADKIPVPYAPVTEKQLEEINRRGQAGRLHWIGAGYILRSQILDDHPTNDERIDAAGFDDATKKFEKEKLKSIETQAKKDAEAAEATESQAAKVALSHQNASKTANK